MSSRPNVEMMVMVHRAFARDLQRLADSMDECPTEPARVKALWLNWELFYLLLEHHHQAEDQALWPNLMSAWPASTAIIERMEAQHSRLDELLVGTNDVMRDWSEGPNAELAEQALAGILAIAEIARLHLADEESAALPLIADHMDVLQWDAFARRNMELNKGMVWTLPWLAEAQSDEVRGAIWSLLPATVVAQRAPEWCRTYADMVETAFGGSRPLTCPPALGM